MYRSSTEAATATVHGEAEDWDTQQCLWFQQQVLSDPVEDDALGHAVARLPKDCQNNANHDTVEHNSNEKSLEEIITLQPDGTEILEEENIPYSSDIILDIPQGNALCAYNEPVSFATSIAETHPKLKPSDSGMRPIHSGGSHFSDLSVSGSKDDLEIRVQSSLSAPVNTLGGLRRRKHTVVHAGTTMIRAKMSFTTAGEPGQAELHTQASGPSTIPLDFSPDPARFNLSMVEQKDSERYHQEVNMQRIESIREKGPCDDKGGVCEDLVEGATQMEDNSMRSQSTHYTYEEGDTGHVNLEYCASLADIHDNRSPPPQFQDASYQAIHQEHVYHQCEPRTPALKGLNPFTQKGSVLRGAEMFGTTQPSAFGTHLGGPTPSLPSPSIHIGASSPQEPMQLSPLQGYNRSNPQTLQSSTMPSSPVALFGQVSASLMPGNHSFAGIGSRRHNTFIREPRDSYVPMRESQERRMDDNASGSECKDLFEISDNIERQSRMIRVKERANQEISSVKASFKERPSSKSSCKKLSRPFNNIESRASEPPIETLTSLTSSGVEVIPSTRPRLSSVDQHSNRQSGGPDARDMQEEVVQDSQQAPKSSHQLASSSRHSSPVAVQGPQLEREHSRTLDTDGSTQYDSGSVAEELELPYQEVSNDDQNMHTPELLSSRILSDGSRSPVPETSPSEDKIKPLAEVTSFLFESECGMEIPPGFTPDRAFNKVMHIAIDSPPKLSLPSKKAKPAYALPNPTNTPASTVGKRLLHNEAAEVDNKENAKPLVEGGAKHLSKSISPEIMDHVIESEHAQVGGELASVAANVASDPSPAAGAMAEAVIVDQALDEIQELDQSRVTDVDAGVPASTPSRMTLRSKSQLSVSQEFRDTASRELKTSESHKKEETKHATSSDTRVANTRSTRRLFNSVVASSLDTPLSSPPSSILMLSGTTGVPNSETPIPSARKTSLKRKASAHAVTEAPIRTSKRRALRLSTEESEDPLASHVSTALVERKERRKLFTNMTFAISYIDTSKTKEKDQVIGMIIRQGGHIEPDGFEDLFNKDCQGPLVPTAAAYRIGFAALIADEHSRKTKYMQALALGLPCLSSRWILDCYNKGKILDWAPYLLCAGQSTYLGGALRSRILQSYPAENATFKKVFRSRPRLLDGHSVLSVAGGSVKSKKETVRFLIRALSPSSLTQPMPADRACKDLLMAEAGNEPFTLLYVNNDKAAERVIIKASAKSRIAPAGSRKRQKGISAVLKETTRPPPRRIRVVDDEFIIQTLILGQVLPEA